MKTIIVLNVCSIVSSLVVRRFCYKKHDRRISDYVGVTIITVVLVNALYFLFKLV